ncbi:MAG: TIR domain-containing protein [Sphingopyxis sp.]|nr:TIR domain-containing protein [Sphingopyxis sp.]
MTDVFISYKREERGRCVAIYNALVDLSLSVWFDAHIEPGTDFDREIEREVRRAKAVLVLWSERAADSDWIRAEARTGRQSERLVAARLDDCLPPLEFASVQAVDLFDRRDFQSGEGWRQIVARIGRLVGRPGLGDYVRCEQDADAGRWRGWIAANSDDPLIDKARQRLAMLMRPDAVSPSPDEGPRSEGSSLPHAASAEPTSATSTGGERRTGRIVATIAVLLLGAVAILSYFVFADRQPAVIDATTASEASPPTESLSGNAKTLPMATGPAGPGKIAFCAPDKPFVATFRPGRTDLPPLWNLTVANAWLAWRECRGPVRVEGHVEAGGGSAADSRAMAEVLAKELVLEGVDPKAISIIGLGAKRPLANPDDPSDNRRVEIYLLPPG